MIQEIQFRKFIPVFIELRNMQTSRQNWARHTLPLRKPAIARKKRQIPPPPATAV